MGDRKDKFDLAMGVISEVLPHALSWIRARLRRGETVAQVIRDMKDRTEEIEKNRSEVDQAFADKFGEDIGQG